MDTHLATTQIRLQQWAAVIKDKNESGLTVNAYCEQHQIPRNQYFYWLRRVKAAVLENSQPTFVELKSPVMSENADTGAGTVFHTQMVIRVNGAALELNEHTPPALLSMALEAVAHAQ